MSGRTAGGAGGETLRVVVDANIIVAALIRPGGWTALELTRNDVEWIAPDFLFHELDEHAAEYAQKSGCSAEEWHRRVKSLEDSVRVVRCGDVAAQSPLVQKAKEVDPDDAVYVEALVAEGADFLWTRDAALLDALPGIAVSLVPRAPAEA